MKTRIYKSYAHFLSRKNKQDNGVSYQFAKDNPDFKERNTTNKSCWNCIDCIGCSNCSNCRNCSSCIGCSNCRNCIGCSNCRNCIGCSNCSDCIGCSNCRNCIGCSNCSNCRNCSSCIGCSNCRNCIGCSNCSNCIDCIDCSNCSNCIDCIDCIDCIKKINTHETTEQLNVPKIKNIHNKLLSIVEADNNELDMSTWHSCETAHCRAGWVVHSAGKAGYKLEKETSTCFAAMQIYKSSSDIPVSPVRFFETDKVAINDIKRCAALEVEQT